MKDGLFHFKKFSVSHTRSSMKVGVDGVLIGAWASTCAGDILDAGTGCGVIALMLAQRNPDSKVLAIDVDKPSIDEASENFINSPWGDRIEALETSYNSLVNSRHFGFDLIVSNPPFYDSGVSDFSNARNVARHQSDFSPSALVRGAGNLLKEQGRVAMIAPSDFFADLKASGKQEGLYLDRCVFVRDHQSSPIKRVMMEFVKSADPIDRNTDDEKEKKILTMFDANGLPTPEYREIGKDFYLKF